MKTRVVCLGLYVLAGLSLSKKKRIDRLVRLEYFPGNKKSDEAKEAVTGQKLRKQQGHGFGEEGLES
jgi:hypothetical protein